jgi:hypothetical protein
MAPDAQILMFETEGAAALGGAAIFRPAKEGSR